MLALLDRGGLLMYAILGLSIIAVAIAVERLLYLQKIKGDEGLLLARLKSTLEKGHFDEALSICEANPTPFANLMKVAIEHRHYSQESIKDAITDAANMEIPRLERYLSFLGTIAHIAPLLGLLGTVTGNIRAFGVLGEFEAAGGNPALLAQGISEALLTTAAGLVVAIPSIIFYNYLVSRVNHMIIRVENRVTELVLLIKGDRRAVQ
ncbi:MAG: MotA/TolQ/ExbB proton channel family protein [Spirochaetaceae bacterium]